MRIIAPKVVLTLVLAVSTVVWGLYAGAQSDDEIEKSLSEYIQQFLEFLETVELIDMDTIDMDADVASGGCPPTDPCCPEFADSNCDELEIRKLVN